MRTMVTMKDTCTLFIMAGTVESAAQLPPGRVAWISSPMLWPPYAKAMVLML